MLEPYNSPVPEAKGQQNGVQYQEHNDIELPASTESRSDGAGIEASIAKARDVTGHCRRDGFHCRL